MHKLKTDSCAKRKSTLAISAVLCCIASAGCNTGESSDARESPENSPSKSSESTRQACEGLFGNVGGKALADLAEGWHVVPLTANAKRRMEKLAQETRSEERQNTRANEEMRIVCKFDAPAEKASRRSTAVLKYGQGDAPSTSKKRHLYRSAGSTLIDIDARRSQFMQIISNIYFICNISENQPVTIRGSISTKWSHPDLTPLEEDEKFGQVLLASSRKFSGYLGCSNNLDLDPTSPVKPLPGGSGKPKDWDKPLPSLPESGPLVGERG